MHSKVENASDMNVNPQTIHSLLGYILSYFQILSKVSQKYFPV